MAVSLHLSILFVTYCNGVLSQLPVSGYNIAIDIIITVFLLLLLFFCFKQTLLRFAFLYFQVVN